jgi:hypothetical protein
MDVLFYLIAGAALVVGFDALRRRLLVLRRNGPRTMSTGSRSSIFATT